MARLKRNMTVKEVLQDHEERHEIAEDFIERHRQWGGPQLYIPNVLLINRDGINLELWDHNAYIRWCNNVDMWNDREDAGEMYMFRWNDATYWVNSLRTIVEGSESVYPEAEMILQVMDDDGLNVPTITWHTNMNTWDNVGDGSYSLVRTAAGGGAETMFYIDKDDIVFNEAGRDTDFRIETDTEVNAFFLNSGTGYLGLRTGTPAAFLHIYTDDVVTDAAMLRIEQDGVGDANLEWYLGPGARFIMGIDNDDGNRWKLAMSSDLGTSTRLVVDTGGDLGIRCNPLANMHLHDPTTFCYFYITTGNRLTDVGIFWGDQYAGTDFYMGIDADDSRLHIGAGGAIGTNSAIQIDNTGALTMVVTNLTMVDGGWIGQAAGPLLTFDDTNDFLEITGCKVGIGVVDPDAFLEIFGVTTQLKLSYDADSFVTFTLDASDDLTIKPAASGGIRFQPTTDTTDFFQVLDQDGGVPILNVDSINERVGVGILLPTRVFHMVTTTANTADPSSPFLLNARSTGDMADGFGGGLLFGINDDTLSTENIIATLYGLRDGADDSGCLTFNTYAGGARSEVARCSSNLRFGVRTISPDTTLQVVGDTKLGDDNTNYATFASDGELTLTGTARVMISMDLEPVLATRPAANPPGEGTEDSFATHDFNPNTDESVFFHLELPHDYAAAGTIHIHFDFFVDLAPTLARSVVWGVEYKKQSIGDNFDFSAGTTTAYTQTALTIGTPANDKRVHQSSEISLTTAGFAPNDYILLRLFRDADGTGGLDNFSSDARVIDYHIEYLSDRLGEAT